MNEKLSTSSLFGVCYNSRMSQLNKLNKELAKLGIGEVKELDPTPERAAYLAHFNKDSSGDEDWVKTLKALKMQHALAFHKHIAHTYPYLRYEIGEDKTYWLYNEETGIYDELNFTTVRGLVIALLLADGLEDKATESTVKTVLSKFRAIYLKRASEYDSFDADSEWFHAQNGWVELSTLKFETHTPDRLSRRSSSVDFKPKAKCPNYDLFLDNQISLQDDQVRVIDQFSGLLLTPDITKQKMLVLIGKPGSGKSTLLDCWSDVLGDSATQKGLTEIAGESFRFGGSSLVGKRLCWFDEVEVTRTNMGNSLTNLITGQHIHVERKGINGIVDVDNQIKCVLTANNLPRSAEIGIYRRMILIYLEYSFYDSMTANQDIRSILKSESSGILNRMLKGLADLRTNKGFTLISGHDDLIEQYKTSSNTVAEFLDEYFDFDEESTPISSKVLLHTYKEFCNDRYSESLTPQRFGVLLKTNNLSKFSGIYAKKAKNGNEWCGLRLKECYEFNNAGWITEKVQEDF